MHGAGGMVEIFLFILVAGLLANFIGASVHEGIFVGALVSLSSPLHADERLHIRPQQLTAECISLQLLYVPARCQLACLAVRG